MLTSSDDMNDKLLVSYLLGEARSADRLKVERWISSDTGHRRYFEHFRTILEASSTIAVPNAIGEEAAWQRFRQRIHQPARVRRLSTGGQLLRIAAAVLVVAATVAMYYTWMASSKVTVYASRSAPRPETLPDGTAVVLNQHSEIRYENGGGTREVHLRGEAFFTVAADKNKPFTVDINDVRITVLGTSFNAKSRDGSIQVVVETGSVRIDRKSKSLILGAGEKTEIGAKDTSISKQASSDRLYNYYRTHQFVCDATPLWKVAEVLNEAYDVHIIIANKELRNQPLTTTFSDEPLDSILNVIGQTFSISIERRGNEIILK